MNRKRYLLRIGCPKYRPDWWLMRQLKRHESVFPYGFHLLAEAKIGENDFRLLQSYRTHVNFAIGH